MTDVNIEDQPQPSPIELIENCVMVINECREWTTDDYDSMQEDKVKIMSNAFTLIAKIQRKLIKEL